MNENVDEGIDMQPADSPIPERGMPRVDARDRELAAECERLRQALVLTRAELAQVRLLQETYEERLALAIGAETERDTLARTLAFHLSRPAVISDGPQGLRARLGRWLLRGGPASPVGERDPLVALIEGSDLFDGGWYLRTYPDVAEAGEHPLLHFLYFGASDRRSPGPRFDTAFYLDRYPDVAASGTNPLVHYLQTGQSEGRLTMPPHFPGTAGTLAQPKASSAR